MGADDSDGGRKAEELTAVIREIQDRVRARYPGGTAPGTRTPLPDLLPILHARDAAAAKVAAIGTVNPRPAGPVNSLIQAVKRQVARALDWHVRDQVEFNRAILACTEATLEAFNEVNRTLARIANDFAGRQEELAKEIDALRQDAAALKDIRKHWSAWRLEWERKLSVNEIQFLRSVAELQTAFQHRVTLIESNFREMVQLKHTDFEGALTRSGDAIQKRLWADFEQIREEFERARLEYERLIYTELRLVRQRLATAGGAASPAVTPRVEPAPVLADALRFAERFRGSEDYVRERARGYIPYFEGCTSVLDLGCGRGEFLDVMKEAGIPARGIDLDAESVARCRQKGLDVEAADLFRYLDGLEDGSLDGIFCSQVVEHLAPPDVPRLIQLAASKLARDGRLVVETPNPECLAIFATHFYLDPTHNHPVPHPLLVFYFEEAGLGAIQMQRLSPATDSIPGLRDIPESFREAFFGGLDYSVAGRKLT